MKKNTKKIKITLVSIIFLIISLNYLILAQAMTQTKFQENKTNQTQTTSITIPLSIEIFEECDETLTINIKKTTEEKITYNLMFNNKYSVIYWVENKTGGIMKSKFKTSNSNEKTFTIQKNIDQFIIRTRLIGCNLTTNLSLIKINGVWTKFKNNSNEENSLIVNNNASNYFGEEQITSRVIYESNARKAIKYSPFVLIIISIIGYILYKRDKFI